MFVAEACKYSNIAHQQLDSPYLHQIICVIEQPEYHEKSKWWKQVQRLAFYSPKELSGTLKDTKHRLHISRSYGRDSFLVTIILISQ